MTDSPHAQAYLDHLGVFFPLSSRMIGINNKYKERIEFEFNYLVLK